MKNAGLNPMAPTVTSPYHITKISLTLSTKAGFCLVTISGKGAHTVGSYVTERLWDFFDPNVGLMRFASAADFIAYLNTTIPSMYKSLDQTARIYAFGTL
jgi:hypothetical protein